MKGSTASSLVAEPLSLLASSDPPADKPSALVTDCAMQAWYRPSIAYDPQTGAVTWQATSNDENS